LEQEIVVVGGDVYRQRQVGEHGMEIVQRKGRAVMPNLFAISFLETMSSRSLMARN
jgi:hypothetical protein